ncbi:hypothetical protein ACHQM5_021411 [Ranunculus cassubicifolius]
MASSSLSLLLPCTIFTLLLCTHIQATGMFFTLVNNCHYPIWPGIQANSGHFLPEQGGFYLPPLSHRSFPAPTSQWSGRMWARTGCTSNNGHFICATGDCGGKLQCNGAGGLPPATLAQFSIHHGNKDQSSYSVSVVDGFNIPLTITPHEGHGVCPVIGCKSDLVAMCPSHMQHRSDNGHGPVVACKSGCEAVRSDELCCRGQFNSPNTCKATAYSNFFKHHCPEMYTFPHDTPSLVHDCSSPRELKVIFCH